MYGEIWMPVDVGGFYEGLYEISNMGRWKILYREWATYNGATTKFDERITNGSLSHGYRVVCMKKDNIGKSIGLHRLVALAFLPNPNDLPMVNHKNAVRNDNRVENLEWCTAKENNAHAFKMGLMNIAKGERQRSAKLTDEKVRAMRRLYETGEYSTYDLSKIFDIDSRQCGRIVKYQAWVHVKQF
jgi:hypothetical protein